MNELHESIDKRRRIEQDIENLNCEKIVLKNDLEILEGKIKPYLERMQGIIDRIDAINFRIRVLDRDVFMTFSETEAIAKSQGISPEDLLEICYDRVLKKKKEEMYLRERR